MSEGESEMPGVEPRRHFQLTLALCWVLGLAVVTGLIAHDNLTSQMAENRRAIEGRIYETLLHDQQIHGNFADNIRWMCDVLQRHHRGLYGKELDRPCPALPPIEHPLKLETVEPEQIQE